MFYKNTTDTALVIKVTEDGENGLWLCAQDLGKGQGALCNLLDVFKSKPKNGFLKIHFSRGLGSGSGINIFASLDSRVGKEGVSMLAVFMKGKLQNRKTERAAFRGRGEKPFL